MLCRIYNKKGAIERRQQQQQQQGSVISRNMPKPEDDDDDQKPPILKAVPEATPVVYDDFMYLDASDSMPRLHTDSSGSEHVLSPEVESAPKLAEWERDFPFGFGLIGSGFQEGNYQMEAMQEVFAPYMSTPF